MKYDGEVEEELWLLQKLGVELCRAKTNKKGMAAQLINNERVMTIATSDVENLCPGEKWHSAGGVVISTIKESLVSTTSCKLEVQTKNTKFIQDSIEIDTEFNGPFNKFGEKFWMHLFKNEQLIKFCKGVINNARTG
jgi:hypothetical protein